MTQQQRGKRKVRIGIVVSDKMDKTRVVAVHWTQAHPLYQRRVRRITKFKAHDATNASHEGDTVRIVETRPLSRDKRWRIMEVIARGERVEVKPQEIDTALIEEFAGHGEEKTALAAAPELKAEGESQPPAAKPEGEPLAEPAPDQESKR